MILKKLKNRITGWDCLNERMLLVHLKLFEREIIIIGLHAPTNNMPDTMKEVFWYRVSDLTEKLPRRKEVFYLRGLECKRRSKKCNGKREMTMETN